MNFSEGARGSIQRKLTLTVVLTTTSSLFLACLAFVAYDVGTVRHALTRNTTTLAEVVGTNSVAALRFRDALAATETLAALAAVESIVAAVIYDDQGRVFARHLSEAARLEGFTPLDAPEEGYAFEADHLDLARSIVFDKEPVGTIFIRSDTRELALRIERYVEIGLALLACVVGVMIAVAARLRRSISAPLDELVSGAEAIADGDLSTHVRVSTSDEIGALARSFNAMTASLGELVTQVLHSIGDVSSVAGDLEQSAGSLRVEAKRQGEAIDDTAESIGQVTASVLEVNRNVETLADTARDTSSSIVEMDASIHTVAEHMDRLSEAIETTSDFVARVEDNTEQVVGGVTTLLGATEGSLERLQELRTSVQRVKDNAQESGALSDDANLEAGRGLAAVNETIAAIQEISSSFGTLESGVSRLASKSNTIDEILKVIEDVAEQTTMVSLNASIIADRAGEHGAAFSVVAGEVHALSQRVRGSAQEIGRLIEAVQEDTRAAVAAMEEGAAKVDKGVQRSTLAGAVLLRIQEKSESSASRVHEIVEATSRQSGDLERVDQAMLEVKQIVERIVRSTNEQQQATGEIAKAVENIRALGRDVLRSTDAQTRGSGLLTRAVTRVNSMIGQIAEETQAQTRSSQTIEHALQVFRDVTGESTRRVQAINEMVETLSQRSTQLEHQISRLKT